MAAVLGAAEPVAIVPGSEESSFEAQKLPFLLSPIRSAFTSVGGTEVGPHWRGAIIIVSQDEAQADLTRNGLEQKLSRPLKLIAQHPPLWLLR